jgi:hypothetical protein
MSAGSTTVSFTFDTERKADEVGDTVHLHAACRLQCVALAQAGITISRGITLLATGPAINRSRYLALTYKNICWLASITKSRIYKATTALSMGPI